ncbi:glycosyltransferase family 1 protein [Apilactobacillus timberlakei]|uniref:glycosyltransferase family 1 protein n=1 Tax=Apilactobacillus timberlakei TaxID=2008380 RepID=UPI0015E87619|nr:glycosyltransferase family 1 protein [Apilactobacillus timberlakei]
MYKTTRIAMIMGKMIGGGVESVIMNYYRNIDKSKYQFDFIIDNDSTEVPMSEIEEMGGRVIFVAPYQKVIENQRDLKRIFRENNYLIVHSNLNSLSVFPLRAAKKCGVPIRIAHNHNTASSGEKIRNLIKNVLRIAARWYPNYYMAPTYFTGKWLFGKRVANNELYILKNALNLNKLGFHKNVRIKQREDLGYLDSDIVIGNVGRLVWQKNQTFIIDVFNRLHQSNPNYKLLIIGEGPLLDDLVKKCDKLGISDVVKFLKNKSNIEDYYQAMDLFLFPSHYEGLGMVAVEAQVTGLPVVLAKNVPNEVAIADQIEFLGLNESIDKWCGSIQKELYQTDKRHSFINEAQQMGYDISIETKKLEDKYDELLEK